MPRTIYDIPTALSESEVWALLSMFLLENGFSKTVFFGKKLYEKKVERILLARLIRPRPPQCYRLIIRFDNGVLHLEFYRYYSGWEFQPGDMLDAYGRELIQNLQPTLTQIASNQTGSGFFVAIPQQTKDYQQPMPGQPFMLPQGQAERVKRKNGFAIASMLLGILTIPAIPFIAPSIVIGIIGFILGLVSLLKKRDGKGMAIAGIVLNTLGVLLEVLFIIYLSSLR